MSDLIYLGTVEYPDDGIRRHEDGTFWYHPELDVNGVHRALLNPTSGYGQPPSATALGAAASGADGKPQVEECPQLGLNQRPAD